MRWKRMRSVEREMTKQEWQEPQIPVKSSKLWLRSTGPADEDVFGVMGLFPEQKFISALRMLAYGASADQVDEISRMGKATILESLMRFWGAIESIYTAEYL
ncbi:hypothetical protein ACFX13_013199 [Malus domestica]